MRTTATIACAGLLLAAASTANAAGLRCGNALVSQGDSIISVQEKCGEPIRQARLVNDYGRQIGTVWYIDAGYGKADRRITFRGGRVARIERVR